MTSTVDSLQPVSLQPVINKTDSFFGRDPDDMSKVSREIPEETMVMLQNEPYVITVKTDGSCGIIFEIENGRYLLMRRQDTKVNSRNHEIVMKNGKKCQINGIDCYFVDAFVRGSGKGTRTSPLYIFNIDQEGNPIEEHTHIIGFTPVLQNYGEDKYMASAIDGTNGEVGMKLWTTVFEGTLDIPIRCIPVTELMEGKKMMTVEIMGNKVSNRYGYTNDRHFINPHGSIVYPKDLAPKLDFDFIKAWFMDSSNRWADVEGFVIHFPSSNKRLKLHRGHVGLEKTWQNKKESGIRFMW